MSYFCQFCDKEMVFKKSVVLEKEYITCGNASCIAKAKAMAKSVKEEYALKTMRLLIFSSTTPEDPASWRIISKKRYPEFLKDPEVLRALAEGYVVGLQPEQVEGEDKPVEVHYCARNTEEVLRQLVSTRQEAELNVYADHEKDSDDPFGDQVWEREE